MSPMRLSLEIVMDFFDLHCIVSNGVSPGCTFFDVVKMFLADMITPNFSFAEMSCSGKHGMNEKLMHKLQHLRDKVDPLRIRSVIRCVDHLEKITSIGRYVLTCMTKPLKF